MNMQFTAVTSPTKVIGSVGTATLNVQFTDATSTTTVTVSKDFFGEFILV